METGRRSGVKKNAMFASDVHDFDAQFYRKPDGS
jgi:hypothetical protein